MFNFGICEVNTNGQGTIAILRLHPIEVNASMCRVMLQIAIPTGDIQFAELTELAS